MGDDQDQIVESNQGVAFDFRRGILSLGAHGQEMNELNVIV